MFCDQCGASVLESAKFCPGCGTSIARESSTPPPPPNANSESAKAYAQKLAARKMNFLDSLSHCFLNYARFKGRGSRSEYWYFWLFVNAANLLFLTPRILYNFEIDTPLSFDNSNGRVFLLAIPIFTLLTFIPMLAAMVRRLHDSGHSGWSILLSLIPIVGPIVLLVWTCSAGEPITNKYGPAN